MKKFLCALSALVLSAGVCSADYSQKVTSNVALLHGVPGPMDFSQLFTSQADFDYYCSTGKLTTGVSPTWMAIRPLPYDGQIVALAINGQEPKAYILKSKANGMFDAVKMATDTSVQTALAGLTNKRDIRDEYHYALEWDFTEFNAIKDNVGYKVAKDDDNEYIWKVYKVVPGEDDVAIANCSKVDPEEEEPTKLKIIVADLTDGDYAGLVDKIIYAYPSKTSDKFALKSDVESVQDDVDSLSAQMPTKVTQLDNYVYTPVGTNFILTVSGVKPNMKLYIYGVNSLPLTGSLLNLKTTPSNIKLVVAGFSNPFTPISFLDNSTADGITAKFAINSSEVNIRIERSRVGFWDPNVLRNWFYEDLAGIIYEDQTAPNAHKFAGRTYEEAAVDAAGRLEERIGHFVNATNELTIGSGATNVNHMESVTLNGCQRWPSYTWGFANVNIGLDNVTGFGDDGVGGVKNSEGVLENGKAYYDVVIGTSSSAKYMHSYVFGSQAHALAYNSFIFGYGATATDPGSTIIGFGTRPAVKQFNTFNDLDAYLKSFVDYTAATNAIHADMKLSVTNDVNHFVYPSRFPYDMNGDYYIKQVYTSKTGGSWAELYQDHPHPPQDEIIAGRHNAGYGKTHGKNTINLITRVGDELGSVYLNDTNLKDLITSGSASKMVLTDAQKSKFNFMYHGYDENAAVEIGKDAHATPDISTSTGGRIRSVSVAIGAQANATAGSPDLTSQAIAIGYCAKASGSQAIAIGAGSRHFDDEDDLTGDNTYAHGSLSMAIGYGVKALADNAVAIGTSSGGDGANTISSGKGATAIGFNAAASGEHSFALGANVKAIGARSFALGDNATTTGADGIAIGNNSSIGAAGVNSVQLGAGSLNLPNSLKFGEVFIVKNGELVGGTVEATETDLSEASMVDDTTVLKLKSGSNVTVLPKISATEFEELAIEPAVAGGKRNYTVTLPNEPNLQDGLPIQFKSELPEGTKLVFRNGTKVFNKLPVQIKSEQPYDKLVIFTIDVMDDGTDWTPVVNRNNITYSGGKFANIGTTALRGHNLHAATEFKIVYPISATENKTNDVLNLTSGNEFSLSHLYRKANMSGFNASPNVHTINSDGDSWFEVIYKTVNGTAVTERKTFNTVTGITEETEGLKRLVNKLVWHMPNSDVPGTGYFEVSVTNAANSSIIASTNEVSVTYTLATNAKNTIKLADMTFSGGANGGIYKTGTITGLKIGGTNTLDYVTIDDDRTNSVICVVNDPNL